MSSKVLPGTHGSSASVNADISSSNTGATDTPFAFITPLPERTPLRQAITQAWRMPETQALPPLMDAARLPADMADRIHALAKNLVQTLRNTKNAGGKEGLVQGLLQEFSLSSQEGVALMCLAEALLRIPDNQTRDALIRDKIQHGDWKAHRGESPSLFVNAATWGLMLTGKFVAPRNETGMAATLGRAVKKGGEPLIRKAVDVAMRMMGEQFVTGETIEQALKNAVRLEEKGFRYSYDMLGEAAMTAEDAQRYLADYEQAIHAIGKDGEKKGVYKGPGISIKLSALHPRYRRAQLDRVFTELYPIVLDLAKLAANYDIGLNIDAEEAERLEPSLELFERLCHEPELAGWDGLGFVVQAYQKRCPFVLDYLIDLAQRSKRRIMIRLVKGAYWDTEIKQAQLDGLDDYPVYTRKPYSDVSFIACARKLLAATQHVYPQFATHNAQTLATIYELADPDTWWDEQYEFQCLHGMGEALYGQVVGQPPAGLGRPCRIYAPVGSHDTLLAYLVRRLLENGANTSFVNQIADKSIDIETLIQDPVDQVNAWVADEGTVGLSHPRIPLPPKLYGDWRKNSQGLDLNNDDTLSDMTRTLRAGVSTAQAATPLLAEPSSTAQNPEKPVLNPSNHQDVVGTSVEATAEEIESAIATAATFAPTWADTDPAIRAQALLATGDLMEQEMVPLIGLLVREAGKSYANAVAEVREAVDFLRFYSAQVKETFNNATHTPLGVVTCISPWNFPLAIFTGQIAAALAAGNTVLAKPADQTCLIATAAIRLFHQAGVPAKAVQLVPGRGSTVGPLLTDDERIQGVMFTGSTGVAQGLQRTLAKRLNPHGNPIPLVAETGGQNAMIVDSSALAEQVVEDVIMSAFDSAGQRCSALRVLFIQEDVADSLITMIQGAMSELSLGNPTVLANDVGPVIDARARDAINQHIDAMRERGRAVHQLCLGGTTMQQQVMEQGTFVPPTLIELESLSELTKEVFGPVLHVIRYQRHELDAVLSQIAATGYGLTMGLHTRIDETIQHVTERACVGNVYVNRNMVGAVVGVQPFGGQGLSGTGPKAGGPLYLYRLLATHPGKVLDRPFGVRGTSEEWTRLQPTSNPPLDSLQQWCTDQGMSATLTQAPAELHAFHTLTGPTGEENLYTFVPPQAIFCTATDENDLIHQVAAVLTVGSVAVLDSANAAAVSLHNALPAPARDRITLTSTPLASNIDVAIHHGDKNALLALLDKLADQHGKIVTVVSLKPGDTEIPLERLVRERAISINTAAAGGNASLMTMA